MQVDVDRHNQLANTSSTFERRCYSAWAGAALRYGGSSSIHIAATQRTRDWARLLPAAKGVNSRSPLQ